MAMITVVLKLLKIGTEKSFSMCTCSQIGVVEALIRKLESYNETPGVVRGLIGCDTGAKREMATSRTIFDML